MFYSFGQLQEKCNKKKNSSVYLSLDTVFHNGMINFSMKQSVNFSNSGFLCGLAINLQQQIHCTISYTSVFLQFSFRTVPCWIEAHKTDLNAITTKSDGLWKRNGHITTPYRAVSNTRQHWWFACVVFNQQYSVCTPFMHYGWGTSWTTSSPFVLPDAPVTSYEKPHGPVTALTGWDTVPLGELLIRPVASSLCDPIMYTVCVYKDMDKHTPTHLQCCLPWESHWCLCRTLKMHEMHWTQVFKWWLMIWDCVTYQINDKTMPTLGLIL